MRDIRRTDSGGPPSLVQPLQSRIHQGCPSAANVDSRLDKGGGDDSVRRPYHKEGGDTGVSRTGRVGKRPAGPSRLPSGGWDALRSGTEGPFCRKDRMKLGFSLFGGNNEETLDCFAIGNGDFAFAMPASAVDVKVSGPTSHGIYIHNPSCSIRIPRQIGHCTWVAPSPILREPRRRALRLHRFGRPDLRRRRIHRVLQPAAPHPDRDQGCRGTQLVTRFDALKGRGVTFVGWWNEPDGFPRYDCGITRD